jgi:hypothetical protein
VAWAGGADPTAEGGADDGAGADDGGGSDDAGGAIEDDVDGDGGCSGVNAGGVACDEPGPAGGVTQVGSMRGGIGPGRAAP